MSEHAIMADPAPDVSALDLASLSHELRQIADAIVARAREHRDPATERTRIAARVAERRAMRKTHLPTGLFGEPGWDMLLDLFVAEGGGQIMTVSSAAIASGASLTTALRWIEELVQLGLVARVPHPHDRRSTLVELTAAGRAAMNRWADDELARELAFHR